MERRGNISNLQMSFRKSRRMEDNIFIIRNLSVLVFIDLQKAFDSGQGCTVMEAVQEAGLIQVRRWIERDA